LDLEKELDLVPLHFYFIFFLLFWDGTFQAPVSL
jgi:hypothetical protein